MVEVVLELDVSVGNNAQELGSQLAVLCKFCMLAHISFLCGALRRVGER